MKSESLKTTGIIIMLGLLVASAFFMRLENFEKSSPRLLTIDEMVYYRMARQVLRDPAEYHTVPYGRELSSRGRKLPSYFFEPLFKHPPLFTYLLALSMKIFGANLSSAAYVSIFMGALMIPLIYVIGALVSNRSVGVLAAVFLWLDPVSILTSQKIWMDTTIAFFSVLAAVCFLLGITKQKNGMFVLSGFCAGLAVNTKYTGILITLAILCFVFAYKRELFSNKSFLFSLLLPFLMLIPWLAWNFQVYGFGLIDSNREINRFIGIVSNKIGLLGPLLIVLFALYLIYKKYRKDIQYQQRTVAKDKEKKEMPDSSASPVGTFSFAVRFLSYFVPVIFFILFLRHSIIRSFAFSALPRTSWVQGFFKQEMPVFYFRQMTEFFLVYLFGFVSILIYHTQERPAHAFARIAAVVLLLFFIVWGNFQSRYILAALPFFLVLASDKILHIYQGITKIKSFSLRLLCNAAFSSLLFYMLLKVTLINITLSYTNNACFF